MLEGPVIRHLFETPAHTRRVAEMIHHEFWTQVPGASVDGMALRLQTAASASEVPLCRVALLDGEVVGTVNLVLDDGNHPTWRPWLAGMVVVAQRRGQGIGSALVRTLLGDAQRLHIPRVYLGTDGPPFYQRLGAVIQTEPQPGFWLMCFDIGVPESPPVAS